VAHYDWLQGSHNCNQTLIDFAISLWSEIEKVYITIIDQKESSTKKIHSIYILCSKILEKYEILLNSFFLHRKNSTFKKTVL